MAADHRVFERVKDTVVNQGYCAASVVMSDALLGCDLGLDSLDLVEFEILVEEEFNIEINNRNGERFERGSAISDVVKLIEGKLSNG